MKRTLLALSIALAYQTAYAVPIEGDTIDGTLTVENSTRHNTPGSIRVKGSVQDGVHAQDARIDVHGTVYSHSVDTTNATATVSNVRDILTVGNQDFNGKVVIKNNQSAVPLPVGGSEPSLFVQGHTELENVTMHGEVAVNNLTVTGHTQLQTVDSVDLFTKYVNVRDGIGTGTVDADRVTATTVDVDKVISNRITASSVDVGVVNAKTAVIGAVQANIVTADTANVLAVNTDTVNTQSISINGSAPIDSIIGTVPRVNLSQPYNNQALTTQGYVNQVGQHAIDTSKAYTDDRIAWVDKRAKDYAASSGASALAVVSAPAEGGLGVATYSVQGSVAIAVGARIPVSPATMINATFSKSNSNTAGGVGLGFKW